MVDPMLLARLLEEARHAAEFVFLYDTGEDALCFQLDPKPEGSALEVASGIVVYRARAGGEIVGGFVRTYSTQDREVLRRTFGLDFSAVDRALEPHPTWATFKTARIRRPFTPLSQAR